MICKCLLLSLLPPHSHLWGAGSLTCGAEHWLWHRPGHMVFLSILLAPWPCHSGDRWVGLKACECMGVCAHLETQSLPRLFRDMLSASQRVPGMVSFLYCESEVLFVGLQTNKQKQRRLWLAGQHVYWSFVVKAMFTLKKVDPLVESSLKSLGPMQTMIDLSVLKSPSRNFQAWLMSWTSKLLLLSQALYFCNFSTNSFNNKHFKRTSKGELKPGYGPPCGFLSRTQISAPTGGLAEMPLGNCWCMPATCKLVTGSSFQVTGWACPVTSGELHAVMSLQPSLYTKS